MIFTESTIKISNNVSKMDSTIVLYRGDKNVEIRFTILQSPFKYSNTVATNVIESTNASYGQLVIKTPNDKPPIFSEVSATKEGTVLFTITKEMIDEIEELGVYTFQIRLLDENKQSRVTIPPVENGIEIKEPIAIEDDNTTNVVGLAKANYAVATLSDVDTPTFDDNGKYIKTNWNDGDIITNASLNKIEDGIYTTNENVTATKKYVDDKITVKILPVDYNKNCITNVADLEPHSIYMSPNDAKFLYLAYEKLSGSLVGFLFTAKVHGRFIYTGAKDDTMIEIMIEGSCYTVHFKTDTVDGHVEKTVFYLTKNNTTEFTPTNDYEPATKKYVDDNTVIYPLPVHTIQENDKTILKIVNIMDLIPGVQYSTYRDINQTKTEGYRVVYICDDGTFKLICTLPVKDKIIHLLKVLHSTNYSTLSYHNTAYKVDYSKHSTNTDIQITKTLQDYIPIANITEYNPTRDYHPATKKYVDDKFICTDIVDNVGTIPKEELQKCNNGTSRYVSSIKFKEFFADYEHCIYQGTYGDKKIRMKYDKDYNRMIAYDLTDVIELGFEFDNNYMYPFNAGTDEVKAYQFTNDLVITKSPVLNPSEVLTKNNTYEYTPTTDYNPATKKYVDDNKITYTVSSKVLATIPASNIKLDNKITINNISINKDRRYYIEFLGSKKLCNLSVSEKIGNPIMCNIGNYFIQAYNDSTNILLSINKINTNDTTTDTFTDLIIYEEEVKYLDNKYLETDLVLQNSISLGRVGNIGKGSSAIGFSVEASSESSHAEGYSTTASGYYSHAENFGVTASGLSSHAEGDNTKASSEYQHVQGKYNIDDTASKYAHIVGNGTADTARSNAHTLDWQGNAWYAGKLSQEGAPTEDKDLVTKKYMDDKVSSLPQISFNENGELVVTINGVSKTFVPKNV